MGLRDTVWLILAPYRSHTELVVYPDSRVVRSHCGHLCWLSPQGEARFLSDYNVCMDCGRELIDDPEGEQVVIAGALDAFRARFGDDAVIDLGLQMRGRGMVTEEEWLRKTGPSPTPAAPAAGPAAKPPRKGPRRRPPGS